MVGLIAYLVDPSTMQWSSVPLPEKVRALGVASFPAGGLLLIWTLRTLGKNLTDTVVTRREHTLVLHGSYRWVRHPFYDAVLLILLGVSLIAANWFLLLVGASVLALIWMRTRKEEDLLLVRFGSAYREYMRRTGRFFPRR